MTDLHEKYRAAPRQRSPEKLDNLILAKAAERVPVRRQARTPWLPWKVIATSFSVAGLGVALVVKNGVPPLHNNAGFDPAVVAQDSMPGPGVVSLDNAPVSGNSPSGELGATRMRASNLAVDDAPDEESELLAETVLPDASVTEPLLSPLALAEDSPVQPRPNSAETDLLEQLAVERRQLIASNSVTTAKSARPTSIEQAPGDRSENNTNRQTAVERLSSNSRLDRLSTRYKSSFDSDLGQQEISTGVVVSESKRSGLIAEQWLRRQLKGQFTIQLAEASNSDYLVRVGESLDLSSDWYVVQSQTGSQPGYRLLFGVFETFGDAKMRIKTLGLHEQLVRPMVQNFADLKSKL